MVHNGRLANRKHSEGICSVVFWDLCRLHADWNLHVSNRTKLHSHTALQIIMNQYTESLASLLVCAPSQLKHNTFPLMMKTVDFCCLRRAFY